MEEAKPTHVARFGGRAKSHIPITGLGLPSHSAAYQMVMDIDWGSA